jgi:hypothetical protein
MESLPMPCQAEPSPSLCLAKSGMPFLPTDQFQRCLCKSADPTSEQHTLHILPNPQNVIQCSPWADWIPPQQNWKAWTVNCNLVRVGWNAEPVSENRGWAKSWTLSQQKKDKEQRLGGGAEATSQPPIGANYQQAEMEWGTSTENGGGVTSQPPNVGPW